MDFQKLAQRYPHFTTSELEVYYQQFNAAKDLKHQGNVHQRDLDQVAAKAGAQLAGVLDKLRLHKVASDYVTFEQFLQAVAAIRKDEGIHPLGTGSFGSSEKIVFHGQSESTTHTIHEETKVAFTAHINSELSDDLDLKGRLPMKERSMQIFSECCDGLILAKLINKAVPHTIDERVLNIPKGKPLNAFHMTENNNLVINSAKAIGCSVVNIGAQDLIEGREHLIMGLIWQIIKIGLSAKIDMKVHPEIYRLLDRDENLEAFLALHPEQILLRWVNHQLRKSKLSKTVTNFGSDVKDGEVYIFLMNQLQPRICTLDVLSIANPTERAEKILSNADTIGCRKYLTVRSLLDGNTKLNFAFTANLFNMYPGLDPLSDTEMASVDSALFSGEGSREARAFALWLNSMGVDPFVHDLFESLKDGLILLQAIDKMAPGMVDWKKVNKGNVTSRFKQVENCNYVLTLGKELKFSLVGIQGSDIMDGVKTLTLGFVWQLMRENIVRILQQLSTGGKPVTDADIIAWANVAAARTSPKPIKISSFKDANLKNSIFILNVLDGIQKGIMNNALINHEKTEEACTSNAKYAISMARKLGATIFVMPDDIVELRPKMIMTFLGALMAFDK